MAVSPAGAVAAAVAVPCGIGCVGQGSAGSEGNIGRLGRAEEECSGAAGDRRREAVAAVASGATSARAVSATRRVVGTVEVAASVGAVGGRVFVALVDGGVCRLLLLSVTRFDFLALRSFRRGLMRFVAAAFAFVALLLGSGP